MSACMNKALTMKTGQTRVMGHMGLLLEPIQQGEIDPLFVISHSLPLDSAPAR
jgi:threonine dehydrogenase-like Zn-dependent dehydrogenase